MPREIPGPPQSEKEAVAIGPGTERSPKTVGGEIDTDKKAKEELDNKWEISRENLMTVYDILSRIRSQIDASSGDKIKEALDLRRAGEQFNAAERILSDNEIWEQVPEKFEYKGLELERDVLKSELKEALEESKK